MAGQNPVIVVPGITASSLRDEYPVDPETVWSVLSKQYERTALHPDNIRYERDEPARVVSDQLFELVYGELIKELRHDLTDRADQPTPVYPFAYDWRQPLSLIERQLEAFIDEVIERTKLLRHYHRAGYGNRPQVDLVGHSMGGLIIAGCLEGLGERARAGKVATLGSPFRGSFEAVMKVTTGLATLGESPSSSRERETARLTPALYHLLPSFEDAVASAEGLPDSLYDPDLWQESLTTTIAEYIRLHGTQPSRTKRQRLDQAKTLFAQMLDQAAGHRARLEQLRLTAVGLQTDDDWLCIVGIAEETRVRLKVDLVDGKPVFDLRSADRRNGYGEEAEIPPWQTGDGTAPYEGARCAFIPVSKLLCVSDDDFGYWELRDRALEGLGVGLHGMLPKMNLVHRLIAAHFRAGPGNRARGNRSIWGRPPPRLPADPPEEAEPWDPPIRDLRVRS